MAVSADSFSSIEFLHGLAEIVKADKPLPEILDQALKKICLELSFVRAAITLIYPASGTIKIEASWGLNSAQRRRGAYRPGEGVTGQVIREQKPVYLPDAGNDGRFLNRTGARDLEHEHISFLCLPILLGGQVTGALSVERNGQASFAIASELPYLEIITVILAQTALEMQEGLSEKDSHLPIVGCMCQSAAMRKVAEQISIVAPSAATVLLTGESGTGKELVARTIYHNGNARKGPFIALNCAALPESLVESELFGHERGSFTGASQTHKGRFEQARDGVLFLDEIGELSAHVQAKLLRVLQEKSFERLGGQISIEANARLIAATNRQLETMVESGEFRRDLFYRLNVFPIHLPALRDRKEDILPLANYFLEKQARLSGKKTPRLSNAAIELLEGYDWPGNVRELQNVIERTSLLAGTERRILPAHMPGIARLAAKPPISCTPSQSLRAELEKNEKAAIEAALVQARGRIVQAAASLGMTQRVLGLRLKKYKLDYKTFREPS